MQTWEWIQSSHLSLPESKKRISQSIEHFTFKPQKSNPSNLTDVTFNFLGLDKAPPKPQKTLLNIILQVAQQSLNDYYIDIDV